MLVGLEDTGTLVKLPRNSIQSGRSTAEKRSSVQCALDSGEVHVDAPESGDTLWSEQKGTGDRRTMEK
jgi:hypothetical protein